MSFRRFVRDCIRRAGFDVQRFNPQLSEPSQLVKQLSAHHIDVVFDVGANTGQFAQGLRDARFPGRIISFEPSTAAHSILRKRAHRDANWLIAPPMALGDHEGTITLNLAWNSVSSSILPMLPSHSNAAPKSHYVGSEIVNLRTLDGVGKDLITDADRIFLKLDVQGFEYNVLQGAQHFLGRVAGIQLEMSLVPLYAGERLFHAMLNSLEDHGYEMWSMIPGFIDPNTGRLLQVDTIFFRKEPVSEPLLVNQPESQGT
jgi:FkbM family methyltransferase